MRMAGITGSPGLCLMRYSTVNVRPQRGNRDGLNGRKERKARPVHPGRPAGWMVLRGLDRLSSAVPVISDFEQVFGSATVRLCKPDEVNRQRVGFSPFPPAQRVRMNASSCCRFLKRKSMTHPLCPHVSAHLLTPNLRHTPYGVYIICTVHQLVFVVNTEM